MKWFYGYGSIEKICSTTTFAYCSPLQTQVINSSYHATKSEDGCTHFTRLAVAALLLLLPKLTTIWNHNSIDSATFILSAMPGSFDSSFDVSHAARLIIFIKIIFKIKAPFSFNGKIIPTKNVIELAFLQKKSLILFYCLLLDVNKKLFCYFRWWKTWWSEVSTKYC